MANKLQIKRSAVPGKVPTVADLDLGELAINTYDGKAYMKKNVSGVETVVLLTGAGAGDVLGPSSSGDNAIARFDATSGKIIQNSSATVDDDGNINALTMQASGTGANKMPVGTTAQRPATPAAGMYRMNSTTGYPEWYDVNTSAWVKFPFESYYAVEALVVAGGGGSGASSSYIQTNVGNGGGGGGAGGLLLQTANFIPGNSYTITVGAGGSAGTANVRGGNGGNSQIGSLTAAVGGGGGGTGWNNGPSAGGSGGGNGGASSGLPLGGSGTAGQGNRGGNRTYGGASGCGGGGASSAGVDFTANANYGAGTSGGSGTSNSYSGSAVTYAAGGNGGAYNGGSNSYGGSNAAANTGNGGTGGAGSDSAGGWYTGGTGGSGIVIIRYPGVQRGAGGTVTSANGYTIHTFTSSGTFVA